MFTKYFTGYGFVDFESPQAADVAVQALQAQGIQAQMAKVRATVIIVYQYLLPHILGIKGKLAIC